jgi:ribosomal-protein-alanine N-acetyltransferase
MESELRIMSLKNIQQLRNDADIRTSRLDLIAVTLSLLQCEMEGGADFAARFGALAAAEIPSQWPPQDWEPHVLDYVLRQLTVHPETLGWTRLVALRDGESGERTLIGTVGAIPPGTEMAHSAPEEIEVGYGILPAFQRRGFATEALAGMMDWVGSRVKVSAFVAQTFPHLHASIRVLEKSGFQPAGDGFEEGTILFRLDGHGLHAGSA